MATGKVRKTRKKTPKRTRTGEIDYLSRLDPKVRRWLNTPDPDDEDEDNDTDDHYERWLLKRMADNQIMNVGGVLVDRYLLEARFACVPELCSPAVDRGRYRSCCADLTVYLTGGEITRVSKYRDEIGDHLKKREPRLADTLKRKRGRYPRFFLDDDGDAFCRPGERCIFSLIDSRGRIRCHLHAVHRKLGIEQSDVQPFTCRLFPLVMCHMSHDRVLMTAINRQNYRAWGGKHPRYFPCMSEDDLPPLLTNMRSTLDWLFGQGFTAAIRQAGRRMT